MNSHFYLFVYGSVSSDCSLANDALVMCCLPGYSADSAPEDSKADYYCCYCC